MFEISFVISSRLECSEKCGNSQLKGERVSPVVILSTFAPLRVNSAKDLGARSKQMLRCAQHDSALIKNLISNVPSFRNVIAVYYYYPQG